jgi:iron complex transport system substrate-binding protein
MKANWIGMFLLALFIGACDDTKNQSENTAEAGEVSKPSSFEPEVNHAQHFEIGIYENFKSLIIKNPWESGDTLVAYALYPKGQPAPSTPWAEFSIPVPIDEVVATSSPHVGLIGLVGESDKISGVADAQYIYDHEVYGRVNSGDIAQIGSLQDSNLEILLGLSPDLLMRTGFENVRNEDSRLIEAGIPICYDLEWMEPTMLARAEWIKFVGLFFDKDREADSIFRSIEAAYSLAIKEAAEVDYRPSILTGNNFKGTWYMPGGESYLAKLILEAGGDYYLKDDPSNGSLPLSFEVVLDELINADYWIGPSATSLKELEMMNERYTLFKAFQEGNVYTFDKRISENGGNDYWETGMVRPDLILKDVIKIVHPELLPGYELYYYKKLQ